MNKLINFIAAHIPYNEKKVDISNESVASHHTCNYGDDYYGDRACKAVK